MIDVPLSIPMKDDAALTRTALAIRHVYFEDLGTFAPVLKSAGYRVLYADLGTENFGEIDSLGPDLLVVLGGPVGVYDDETYPYLAQERQLLSSRLAAGRPTLGICLGAQQIAAALGAEVGPMGHKEIGFSALTLTEAGKSGPLRHLEGVPVLHWHGDAFEIPAGASNLASTPLCATQAFALGDNLLALQFHLEIDAPASIERWLTGHALELSVAGFDPRHLRTEAIRCGHELAAASRRMLSEWLEGLKL